MSNQLIKNTTLGTLRVYPKTYTEGITDKSTGKNLAEILSNFNMYFLSYIGNTFETRCQVPKDLRREGLWITYVDFNHKVITEWYNSDNIDNETWGIDTYWRQGSNKLIGDISISVNGNWVINGKETEFKATGDPIKPLLRVNFSANKLQVSYDDGNKYENLGDNPVYTLFRTANNKLLVSTDLGKTWADTSEPIAAWFRWVNGDTADSVGKLLISRDELETWTDLSPNIVNNLRIKDYVTAVGNLPSNAALGDIYMVGPTYDESDTTHNYPHYRMWVKLSSGWVDSGEYLSNVLMSLTTGLETGITMSLKAITDAINEETTRAEAAEQKHTNIIEQEIKTRELQIYNLNQGNIKFNVLLKATNKGYIKKNGTTIIVEPNWIYTDYISVKQGTEVECLLQGHLEVSSVTFYSYDKNVLQTNSTDGKMEQTVIAPENSAYVRVCGRNKEWETSGGFEQKAFIKFNVLNIIEEGDKKANSVTNFKGIGDENGDGVSIYRNIGSKAIWNFTHKYAEINLDINVNTFIVIRVMFYDYENISCGSFHIGCYAEGKNLYKVVSDNASPFIETIEYTGSKILITFTNTCNHRVLVVSEIATTNRFGNIEHAETSFCIDKPSGDWNEIKVAFNINQVLKDMTDDITELQKGIMQQNLYLLATNLGYISVDGLSVRTDNNWRYTDYISVIPKQTIDCILHGHNQISSVTFYNASREVLQTNVFTTDEKVEQAFIAPANSAYVRICGGNPVWSGQTYEQYANTDMDIVNEINYLKEEIIGRTPSTYSILSPYAIYTTCNNVVPTQKGRNRNYSQAIYLDHLFNGITKELEIRFKDNIDKVVFNAPIVVTDSNETSPAVTFNGGENIHEEETTCYIHGKDIEETSISVKHRSTLNSITSSAHPKVLCIGDSITYAEQANIPDDNYTQNYAYHLICKELFMKDKIDNGNIGYDITFLGIYKKQKKFTYNDKEYDVITHHEGIRGISLSQHLNGIVTQFKDDTTGKWSLQAWLNKYRTLNDDGDRLTLGDGTGTLINSSNINNIDVCTPTHVIIMLGANGGGTLEQWQEMVNTIKSEFPDVIIGIAISDAAGTYFPSLHPNCNYLCTMWNDTGSQGSRHNQQYKLQKMLQEYYGTSEQEANNVYMLPFFFVAPTAESVALRTVPLPDAEYSLMNNNKFYDHYGWHASTHVNGIGQTNWGYSLYSWLKYTIAKAIN